MTDLLGDVAPHVYTRQMQIECVERELFFRRAAYPKWVAQGRLTQKKADYELGCMEAVLKTMLGGT